MFLLGIIKINFVNIQKAKQKDINKAIHATWLLNIATFLEFVTLPYKGYQIYIGFSELYAKEWLEGMEGKEGLSEQRKEREVRKDS